MIRMHQVDVVFKKKKTSVHAVKNVSVTIRPGEIFGIIGYSGAGKSTLLRCINLLEVPTSGEVHVDNVVLKNLSKTELKKERTKIGMIFQQFNLISSKTVSENIAFNLKAAGIPKDKHGEKIQSLLELVGLSDKASSYPNELSGGQKQRVGIARALVNDPKILLCDEATSALDPETTKQILDLLKDINQKLGITIVLVTHEMEVIKSICHRVAVMEQGEIVEENDVYRVFANPQSDLMKQFVSSLYDDALPDEVFEKYEHDTLVRLVFDDTTAEEPIVNNLKDKFNVTVTILQGKIEYVQQKPLGHLTIALSGEQSEIESVINYLTPLLTQVKVVKKNA